MIAPRDEFYSRPETEARIAFDLRIPGTAARLHRERAAWADNGDIEALDQNHYVLTVRPGVVVVEAEEGGTHGE